MSAVCWIEKLVYWRNLPKPNRYYILMLPQSMPAADDPGLRHVYEYDVSSGEETALFAPKHSEVATVLMDFKGEEIVMVRYQDEAEAPLIFDPQLQEIYATLQEAFPGARVSLQSITDDLSRAVFGVSSPLIPGALIFTTRQSENWRRSAINIPV